MKYRKKPLVFEAFQPHKVKPVEWPDWANECSTLILNKDVWLVRGEIYPVKDSVFRASYEELAE